MGEPTETRTVSEGKMLGLTVERWESDEREIDEGEEPLETAQRELEEETGLRGGTWRAGPVFYTTPGFCRERIHLFFAEQLEGGEPRPDASEELELVRWPKDEVVARLNQVEDAKTFVGLLLYARAAS